MAGLKKLHLVDAGALQWNIFYVQYFSLKIKPTTSPLTVKSGVFLKLFRTEEISKIFKNVTSHQVMVTGEAIPLTYQESEREYTALPTSSFSRCVPCFLVFFHTLSLKSDVYHGQHLLDFHALHFLLWSSKINL